MKKLDNKNKILILISLVIIIAGIIVTTILGINHSLRYKEAKVIEMNLQKEFNISDIKQITNEVMPKQKVIIQKVEVFEDAVSITSTEITDEQKSELVNKINEKYSTEINAEELEITTTPNTRISDLVKPYLMPFVVTTVIVLAYMAIRYYKINSVKVVVKLLIIVAFVEALYGSIIAITRIPFGILTMPISVVIYIITLMILTNKFEIELSKKNEKSNKKK